MCNFSYLVKLGKCFKAKDGYINFNQKPRPKIFLEVYLLLHMILSATAQADFRLLILNLLHCHFSQIILNEGIIRWGPSLSLSVSLFSTQTTLIELLLIEAITWRNVLLLKSQHLWKLLNCSYFFFRAFGIKGKC